MKAPLPVITAPRTGTSSGRETLPPPVHPLRTVTLGCRVNQYETQFVRQGLARAGYYEAPPGQPAELCVVNTCTVTAEGDSKSRQVIRRLARDNPAARIVVMGCYATRAPHEVARLSGVVDVVTDKRELPDLLQRYGVVDVPRGLSWFDGRKRAFVKVQDGCLLRCSYCIIPHVRPPLTSRPATDVLDEIRRLVDHGHREVVLTGIHLGHYGVDLNRGLPKQNWTRLAGLLAAIVRLPGQFRVRLSSIEATETTRELLDVMAAHGERVCPHLHVALQSGSDAVLRRMRRRWGRRRAIDRCLLAQRLLDRPALTTDVIVGFPGETEADFAATCSALTEIGSTGAHIFPFSPRRGTPAATMPDQISGEVKRERVVRLTQLDDELRSQYARQLVGRRLQVLVEGSPDDRPDVLVGTACRFVRAELPAAGVPRTDAARQPAFRGLLVDAVVSAVPDSQPHIVEALPC